MTKTPHIPTQNIPNSGNRKMWNYGTFPQLSCSVLKVRERF